MGVICAEFLPNSRLKTLLYLYNNLLSLFTAATDDPFSVLGVKPSNICVGVSLFNPNCFADSRLLRRLIARALIFRARNMRDRVLVLQGCPALTTLRDSTVSRDLFLGCGSWFGSWPPPLACDLETGSISMPLLSVALVLLPLVRPTPSAWAIRFNNVCCCLIVWNPSMILWCNSGKTNNLILKNCFKLLVVRVQTTHMDTSTYVSTLSGLPW